MIRKYNNTSAGGLHLYILGEIQHSINFLMVLFRLNIPETKNNSANTWLGSAIISLAQHQVSNTSLDDFSFINIVYTVNNYFALCLLATTSCLLPFYFLFLSYPKVR